MLRAAEGARGGGGGMLRASSSALVVGAAGAGSDGALAAAGGCWAASKAALCARIARSCSFDCRAKSGDGTQAGGGRVTAGCGAVWGAVARGKQPIGAVLGLGLAVCECPELARGRALAQTRLKACNRPSASLTSLGGMMARSDRRKSQGVSANTDHEDGGSRSYIW